MINVDIRVFGPLHAIVRKECVTLELPEGATGESAFETLASQYPPLRAWRSSLRLAVNLAYEPFDRNLRQGDEISFIPPVSGG